MSLTACSARRQRKGLLCLSVSSQVLATSSANLSQVGCRHPSASLKPPQVSISMHTTVMLNHHMNQCPSRFQCNLRSHRRLQCSQVMSLPSVDTSRCATLPPAAATTSASSVLCFPSCGHCMLKASQFRHLGHLSCCYTGLVRSRCSQVCQCQPLRQSCTSAQSSLPQDCLPCLRTSSLWEYCSLS